MPRFFFKKTIYGGIDNIEPSSINGWLYSPKEKIEKVGLYCGDILIKDCEINILREDIAKKFNCDGFNGFQIKVDLDSIKDLNNKKSTFSVRTISNKKSYILNLNYLPSKKETNRRLKQILSKKFIGLKGYFDGFNKEKNTLEGWVYQQKKETSKQNIIVWILFLLYYLQDLS